MAKVRVCRIDTRNWAVQILYKGRWENRSWHTDLERALKNAVRVGLQSGEAKEILRLFNEAKGLIMVDEEDDV